MLKFVTRYAFKRRIERKGINPRTAQSFHAAGGKVTLQVWEAMPHVFPLFHFLPEGKLALQHMLEFFNTHTLPASYENS